MPASLSPSTFSRLLGSWRTSSREPAYRALAHAVRSAVLDGRIVIGTRLPAEREAAAALQVSRTTIASAYAALRDEGWVLSRQGSGSVVQMAKTAASRSPIFPGMAYDDDRDILDLTTAALPAPLPAFDEAVSAAMQRLSEWTSGPGYHQLGLPELRSRIARHYTDTGLATTPEQVLITNGAQHGLSLCLSELTSPMDRIIIESPTYPAALDVVRRFHRTPVAIGVQQHPDEPWAPDLVTSTFRQSAASAAYLIPDFHNPTGHVMSEAVRDVIMHLARKHGTTVIIDESFRDLAIDDVELPPRMAELDTDGRCITLGSLSKPVWGGLRVGWLRASASIVDRLALARSLGDMAGPVIEQLIGIEVIDRLDACTSIQRAQIRAARDAADQVLREVAPDWTWHLPRGGGMLWLRLGDAVAGEAARIAPEFGVRLAPGTRFGPDGSMDNFLRIPLIHDAERTAEGIRRLMQAVQAVGQISVAPRSPQPLP